MKKYRIRKLTPRECWRLMGFSDEDFDKAAEVNSNTQLYSQAGNSIVVNVLEAIFSQMMPKENEGQQEVPYETIPYVPEKEKEMDTEKKELKTEDILRKFKETMNDSTKVKLMGSINSGNFMIRIEDAAEILEDALAQLQVK